MYKTVRTDMAGTLAPLPDGRIRFHPSRIKTAGVPAKSFDGRLGRTGKLVKGTDYGSVSIAGYDLIMNLDL